VLKEGIMNKKLTPAQERLMALVEAGKVRATRNSSWIVEGRSATGPETRVLDTLQKNKLIVLRLTSVTIVGLIEPKRLWVAFKAGA
jgi:hypothetical protein